jgi:hypothetical protein
MVHQPVRVDGLEPLQGERRAGTVAQRPLEPGPVIGLDADRSIDRETAAVAPLLNGCAILPLLVIEFSIAHGALTID